MKWAGNLGATLAALLKLSFNDKEVPFSVMTIGAQEVRVYFPRSVPPLIEGTPITLNVNDVKGTVSIFPERRAHGTIDIATGKIDSKNTNSKGVIVEMDDGILYRNDGRIVINMDENHKRVITRYSDDVMLDEDYYIKFREK